jgi:hypothetical protein
VSRRVRTNGILSSFEDNRAIDPFLTRDIGDWSRLMSTSKKSIKETPAKKDKESDDEPILQHQETTIIRNNEE